MPCRNSGRIPCGGPHLRRESLSPSFTLTRTELASVAGTARSPGSSRVPPTRTILKRILGATAAAADVGASPSLRVDVASRLRRFRRLRLPSNRSSDELIRERLAYDRLRAAVRAVRAPARSEPWMRPIHPMFGRTVATSNCGLGPLVFTTAQKAGARKEKRRRKTNRAHVAITATAICYQSGLFSYGVHHQYFPAPAPPRLDPLLRTAVKIDAR